MKSFKEKCLKETTLNRVIQHSNDKTYPIAILTASRSDPTISIETQIRLNDKSNRLLAAELEQARRNKKIRGFFMLDGFYVLEDGRKVKDDSYFVIGTVDDVGVLKQFASKLGREFEQESILFRPRDTRDAYLIFMKDGSEMKLGQIHANKPSEFYSKLRHRNGSFVFGD